MYHEITTPILTPDQRLRVFISSTLQELAPERLAAQDAIERMHLIPVLFELGARPHAPRNLYREYLAQSHIFIGIYWNRYGWVAPGETISGLEDEYQLSEGMPRLIYIKEGGDSREPRLAELLKRIQNDDRVSYKTFSTTEELQALIANDLAILLTERFNQAHAGVVEELIPEAYAIPDIPTSLLGRDLQVSQVTDLLNTPGNRLVTLTGPGGIGKSRLAIEIARHLRTRYPDNVAFIPLAPVRDASLVPETISYALGIKVSDGHTLESLKLFLRDRRFLLILDNFEQVIDAAGIIDDLLLAAPGLQIIVTSRERLSLTMEHVYPVPPLGTDHRDETMSTWRLYPPSVELFADRARAVNPAFAVTAQNYETVLKICQRLEGLPLAIELAAGQVHLFTPAQLLQKLNQSLDFLKGQYRDIPDRQRTLRDTIAWSFDLLSAEEQSLLLEMSLYPAGCLLETIEHLGAGHGLAIGTLGALIDKSLVTRRDEEDVIRFQMMESVREFALHKLANDDRRIEFGQRQAAYYRHKIQSEKYNRKGATLSEHLLMLEREHPNLRAALNFLLDQRDLKNLVEIAWDLWLFWWVNAHTREGYHWLSKAWELYKSPGQEIDELTLAKLASNAGTMAFMQRDFETFNRCVLEHKDLIFRQPDDELIGTSALVCGVVKTILKDYKTAGEMLQVSLERFTRIGLTTGMSLALSATGRNASYSGRPKEEVLPYFAESLRLARQEGDEISIIIALSGYALAETLAGDPGAKLHLQEVITRSRRIHFYEALAWSMEIWSLASAREQRLDHAARLMGAVDHLRQTTQLPVWEDLADIILQAGKQVKAVLGQEAFTAAWNEGAAMSLDEMIAFALKEEAPLVPDLRREQLVRA